MSTTRQPILAPTATPAPDPGIAASPVEPARPAQPPEAPEPVPLRRPQPERPPVPRPAAASLGERGQATAEYALVMLAAAAIAGLLLAWAASTDGIGRLLDAVLQSIIRDAG